MENPHHGTALLIMDMQTAVIRNLPNYTEVTSNVNEAIRFARAKQIPVLFIAVQFRPGMPEIGKSNKIFSKSKDRSANVDMSEIMKIDNGINLLPNDIIVFKRRVSAFTGSDLDVILRAMEIKHLILTGVGTGGVVLSTLREAADKDYQITVLSDCCTDSSLEIHELLMDHVFPTQAEVKKLDELILIN